MFKTFPFVPLALSSNFSPYINNLFHEKHDTNNNYTIQLQKVVLLERSYAADFVAMI